MLKGGSEMSMRVRDAVHGDIEFTDTEQYCIRTPVFQRLHGIKQLGNSFHAYPSAMHTRFEHSMGVCFQVKKIVSYINKRSIKKTGHAIIQNEDFLSLAGLLHDITHFPFKHTFERDSGLLEKEIRKHTYQRRFEQMNLQSKLSKEEFESLLELLDGTDAKELDMPYQSQIIQDTFSADLLDYVRRDAYFTGIKRYYDERIYDHIDIIPNEGKDYLGIKLTDEFGKNTASAVTELINLLEVRYVLNERVYFYPVKIAADSLLVRALRALSEEERTIFVSAIENMSDELVVDFFARTPRNELANFYGNLLKNRQLPRNAYTLRHSDLPDDKDYAKIISCFRDRSNVIKWEECEKDIAKEVGADAKNIIIYCHDPGMQEKKQEANNVLVLDERKQPYRFEQHPRGPEISYLCGKHRDLWACYVFYITPNVGDPILEKIRRVARRIMLGA
jgi:HD superfamily phosphohydrolase